VPFSPQMRVDEALAHHPYARWVFAAYHLNNCRTCPSAETETLEELATAYRISLEKFVADLNSLPTLDSRSELQRAAP
jgi:hybrid cluster-associated redox disulfide protein